MTPRVTVLMTVYNGLPHVRQAVESVLDQTLQDFELLIIDDASTDGSAQCVRDYGDAHIRLITNPSNIGQTRSLNRGLPLARAPYVARLDQDDVCFPRRLERQAGFLDGHPGIAVVGSWMVGIDAAGRRLGLLGEPVQDQGMFVGLLLLGGCPLCHPSVMFRREVIARLGGYDEGLAHTEDYDLWSRLAVSGGRARVIPEPLAMYRVHAGQQSSLRAEAHHRNWHAAHQRLLSAFCAEGQARRLSLLLRMDEAFWSECGSKACVADTLEALQALLETVHSRLSLSAAEFGRMRRLVRRRLGPGMRFGRLIARCPEAVFRLLFAVLFPWARPRVHRVLSRVAARARRVRAAMRLRFARAWRGGESGRTVTGRSSAVRSASGQPPGRPQRAGASASRSAEEALHP